MGGMMTELSQQKGERVAPVWKVLSSEVVMTNEGRTVRRTVLANSEGEMRVRIEPIPVGAHRLPEY
jgi:hypothetical protein